MKIKFKIIALALFATVAVAFLFASQPVKISEVAVHAQTAATQTEFDQKATLAKLRDQIKGRESEPAEKVFKNIQMPNLKTVLPRRCLRSWRSATLARSGSTARIVTFLTNGKPRIGPKSKSHAKWAR
jgi:hypothetical protein